MKRIAIPELLDASEVAPAEVAVAISDLNHINRWFGGISTTVSLIKQVSRSTGGTEFSLLDVATGAGYVPQAAARILHRRGIRIKATLVDLQASHMTGRNGTAAVVGNAVSLPFSDRSFDLVSCCLFAHHLSPTRLAKFVNEGLRVCRHAVLINDVVRSVVHLGMAYVSLPIYRSRLTHHDAPASVRQAYTIEEMREMLKSTNASSVEIEKHFLYRMGAVVWK